jgi:hypothetical protein
VFPFTSDDAYVSGRVVAVWDAIGMVDVEYPNGVKRHPVEDLQRTTGEEADAPHTENVPGGAGTVRVPGGPPQEKTASVRRVSEAFVKQALYWASKDRKYKARRDEVSAGNYTCPKCKAGTLRNAIYKRNEGKSERLMGCPECLFLIKRCDIIGHPDYEAPAPPDPLARMRLADADEGGC